MSQTTAGVILSTTSTLALLSASTFFKIPLEAVLAAMMPVLVAFYVASAPPDREQFRAIFLSILRVFALAGIWPAWFWGPQQVDENENENKDEVIHDSATPGDSGIFSDTTNTDAEEDSVDSQGVWKA
ncbi:hypothetical protein F5Y10DRAFT_271464 [Nemania abortiva]|nr:hypothetical protein F5Y10DRAFT_271464 [Nemania abortiva]